MDPASVLQEYSRLVPAREVLTFREGLNSKLSDFLADAGMSCPQTQEALIEMVVALADLREEGAQLFPQVLICDDRETVLRNLQGIGALELGCGQRNVATVARALKKCAPLAINGWAVWISRAADSFAYGVFRRASNPTALDLRETLLNTDSDPSLHALLVAQVGPGRVELVSVGKPSLEIHLSGKRSSADVQGAQEQVVRWWTQDISDEHLKSSFGSFGGTLLRDLLRKGHGALIAVAPAGTDVAQFAKDCIPLGEPVDLAGLVDAHAREASSEALAELRDFSDLLAGMLGSDGITLLDTAGRILAFNWFVKAEASEDDSAGEQGGARHRAFAALSRMVREGTLRGVFIRSSDGGEKAYDGDK